MEECTTSFSIGNEDKFESKSGAEENSMPNYASWYISSSPGADSGDSDSDIIENYFAVEKTEKVAGGPDWRATPSVPRVGRRCCCHGSTQHSLRSERLSSVY